MMLEMNAVIQSVNVLTNLVKAGYSVRNANEIATAVYEINAKLLTVQSAAFAAHEEKVALAQRVRDLEKEIVELKNWNRERERYQLTEIITGVFVYSLKPSMEQGEPPHTLCANCFTKGEKSILQFEATMMKLYSCKRCKSTIPIGARSPGVADLRRV